ncbi:MAG: hypothetical protein ABF242_06785 [Flavobacteriales bacterium]
MNNWKNTLSNSYFSILIIGLVSVIFITQFAWKGNDGKGYSRIIASDGVGYYYYLPNTLLSKTIGNQTPDKRFFNEVNEKGVNKYYVGTAVAMSPFFMLGHMIAISNGDELTGFSAAYHKSISLAGLFYLLGGLLFFRAFLRQYQLKEWVISATLLLLFFGTNLLAYAVLMPSMSHIYSFFFVSGFLFFAKRFSSTNKSSDLYLGMAFLAMIILIRPLNGIIIFALPFLAGSWVALKELFLAIFKPKRIVISLVILFSILFVQAYFWYLQCGKWIVWSYGNEGFYFLKPYLWEVLFSFRKGAFIYTPFLVATVIGLVALVRKNKFKGWSLFLFFALLVYLVSSWWNWYYGPSFGQRPFVEFYGLSGLLIAFAFCFIQKRTAKIALISFSFLCVFLNLIQTYQYHKGIISSWDMTAKKYGYTFLKTGDEFINCLGGNDDIMLYNAKKRLVYNNQITFDNEQNGQLNYTNKEFKFEITIPADESFITQRGVYVKARLKRKDLEKSRKNGALFVVEIFDDLGKKYHYGTFPVSEIPPRNTEDWNWEEFAIEIQEIKSPTDKIKIYIWNQEKQPFLIDDLSLKIMAID